MIPKNFLKAAAWLGVYLFSCSYLFGEIKVLEVDVSERSSREMGLDARTSFKDTKKREDFERLHALIQSQNGLLTPKAKEELKNLKLARDYIWVIAIFPAFFVVHFPQICSFTSRYTRATNSTLKKIGINLALIATILVIVCALLGLAAGLFD